MNAKADKNRKNSTRRERETEWVKDLIVEAAAKVFSRKGYHGATMENIAHAAGYSPAAIYKYFENKEAVFMALQSTITKKISGIFDESPPVALEFKDYLRWFLSRVFVFAEKHRSIFLSFMAQSSCVMDSGNRTEFHKKSTEWYLEHIGLISEIMKRGMQERALKTGNPVVFASAFFGIVYAFVFQWLVSPEPYPLEKQVDTMVDLFLCGAGVSEKTAQRGKRKASSGGKS
jgi:AcrR family transcriptional regulator